MMNPLMKVTIGNLSTETQNAFKVMQGELNAIDSLLSMCEVKEKNLKDMGK